MLAYSFLGPGSLRTCRLIKKVKEKYLKAAMSKVCPWVFEQDSGLMNPGIHQPWDGMVIKSCKTSVPQLLPEYIVLFEN